jgi:hypothetical protein
MTNDVTGSNRTPTDVNQWELRTQILEQFSLEDLKKLCFRIDARLRQEGSSVRVDLDRVEGKTLEGKIVGLIQYLDLRGKLGYLADAVREARPEEAATAETLEQQSRRILLNYFKGYVQERLSGAGLIELAMKERKDLIDHPLGDQDDLDQPGARAKRVLRPADLLKYFDEKAHGALLIVGAPGSGNQTMLFRLADALIARAEKPGPRPMPVVIPLSSWSGGRDDEEQPLADRFTDWLIRQLTAAVKGMGMSKEVFEGWVRNGELVLLLYGLERLELRRREVCLQAINSFLQEKEVAGIAVCTDTDAYTTVTPLQLQFQGAIEMQPLTPEQVDTHLEDAGDKLAPLRAQLRDDKEKVEKYARSPRDLQELVEVYLGMPPEVRNDFSRLYSLVEAQRMASCEKKADDQFRRKSSDKRLRQKDAERWLTWLADIMEKHNEIPFYIDGMQPDWLSSRAQKTLLTILAAASVVLPIGLSAWWVVYRAVFIFFRYFSLSTLRYYGKTAGPLVGLACGLISWFMVQRFFGRLAVAIVVLSFWIAAAASLSGADFGLPVEIGGGLVGALLIGSAFIVYGKWRTRGRSPVLTNRIEIVDRREWSWQQAAVDLIIGVVVAIGWWLVLDMSVQIGQEEKDFGEALGIILGLRTNVWHRFGLPAIPGFGFLVAYLLGLRGGDVEIDEHASPNQGIRRSAQSAVLLGGVGVLIVGLPFMLVGYSDSGLQGLLTSDQALFGLAVGLVCGLVAGLNFGGFACLQHWVLRLLLHRNRRIPLWRYARFLDHAADLGFLAKAGRGYEFPDRWWRCFRAFARDRSAPPT